MKNVIGWTAATFVFLIMGIGVPLAVGFALFNWLTS